MNDRGRLLGALVLAATLTLTGCGTDSDDGTATPTEGTETSQAPGPPEGFDESQLAEIQDCLEAAGLEDVVGEMPTGMPTDLPSEMPSDLPSDLPSGGPGGGMGGLLDDPDVQEALDACGIELPSPGQNR